MSQLNIERSQIFERGQIWYWNDPIFGQTKPEESFNIGESTYRFNRYVIVVQVPETITNKSILVVPISSGNTLPNDVVVPLEHIYHHHMSFAKVSAMMPVHPKMLTQYVCTIPESIMRNIDAEIIKLLCPYVRSSFTDTDIIELFGIDMNVSIDHDMLDTNPSEFSVLVKQFIREEVSYDGQQSFISAKRLKTAFDIWLINKGIDETNFHDDYRFIDQFVRYLVAYDMMSLTGIHDMPYEICNVMEFRGIKLKHPNARVSIRIKQNTEVITEAVEASKETEPEETTEEVVTEEATEEAKNNWSNLNNVIDFVTAYENEGAELCALMYNIGKRTCQNYYTKFKRRIEYRLVSHQLNEKNVDNSISILANKIGEHLSAKKVYKMCKNCDMTEAAFYKKIQSLIYFSITEFLGIKVVGSRVFLPDITENTLYINTWKFFDIIHHDNIIRLERDLHNIMVLGNRYYGEHFGIDGNWLNWLANKLGKFGLPDVHINIICTELSFLTAK